MIETNVSTLNSVIAKNPEVVTRLLPIWYCGVMHSTGVLGDMFSILT